MKTNMEQEIYSQGELLFKLEEKYLKDGEFQFCLNNFDFKSIKFIASGSSYNAIRLGAKFFEKYTQKIVSFDYASEFISSRTREIKPQTLYVFMSQSGETFDTKCALELVKERGGKTLAFVNNSNSSIYNSAEYKIDISAGIENSVAATKSFLSGVVLLWLFALYFSNSDERKYLKKELDEAVLAINETLFLKEQIKSIAKILSKKRKLSIIGYDWGYILAKEGALKIKETSYIDAQAYPTGEFLHGYTAVLNKNKTLIEIFTNGLLEFECNTLKKIEEDFNPDIFAITDKNDNYKNVVYFKNYNSDIAKICAITVILQLLALEIALLLNKNPDKPHGLKKVISSI